MKEKEIKCCHCGVIFIGSNNFPCLDCRNKGLKRKRKRKRKKPSKEEQDKINLKRVKSTKKTKEIKCCYCEKKFIGSFCLPINISPCPECKNIGLKRNYSKEKLKEVKNRKKETWKNKHKKIKCYNCNRTFNGNIHLENNSPCPECRKNGFKQKKKKIEKEEQNKIILKRKKTCLKLFGVDNFSKTKEFLDKSKQTWIKNLGVDNPLKSKEVQEKSKQTMLKNWNVEHALQSPEIRETYKQTSLKNWNVEFPMKSPIVQEIRKQAMLKNWNVEFPLQSKVIQETHKQTILENWNVEFSMQSKEVQEKSKQTMLKNWNVEHALQSPEIRETYKQTSLKNHNVEWPFESIIIQKKSDETRLKKYGNKHYKKSKEYQIKVFENIKKSLKFLNLEFVDEEYNGPSFNHSWKCLKCNNVFQHSWSNIWKCPSCYPRIKQISIGEIEILEFVKSLNISNEIESTNRTIIKPLHLDIYIPDKNIAIEFNGLWWHSEEYKLETYHLYKTQKCLELEIQLIHIFEDEWYFKKEIVKSRLKQILGVNSNERIHARECIIKEIESSRKNEFLDKFHIQGPDNSVIKLGAFQEENLVSVMTFSKGNISKGSKSIEGVWELNRFCSDSNFHIPGIAGKLLSHFKKNYDWNEIFSYADIRWSQGNLYYKLGFKLIGKTGPNYWYVKNVRRIHRFNLRKRPDEPKDIPESILRLNEGYGRIWDCGSIKFQMKKN